MQTARFVRFVASVVICIAALMQSGCQRDFSTEADALRERVMTLEREVESLERENAELRATLRVAARQHSDFSPELLAATPRVAELSIGRLSHARSTARDDEPDEIRVYLQPADGRGRFVPLTGIVRVHAVVLAENEPLTIARVELSPEEIRDAYRAGFTGTHYSIRLPIEWPASVNPDAAKSGPITVRVTYDDGYSGQRSIAERSLTWRIDTPRPSR